MSVIKAERVVDFIGDETLYHFKVEIIEIEKVMVSVFNTQTGVTYKTYINKCDDWFKSNIYIFTGDFKKVFSILNESLIENKETLPHKEYEENDMIKIIINYEHELYPFELELPIKKYVSENGVLDDRINSLEYQVRVLKNMLMQAPPANSKIANLEKDNIAMKEQIKVLVEIIEIMGPQYMRSSLNTDREFGNYNILGSLETVSCRGNGKTDPPVNPPKYIEQLINTEKSNSIGGTWTINEDGSILSSKSPDGMFWSGGAWLSMKKYFKWDKVLK